MPKNGGFSHFFAIRSLEFANFFGTKPSLWSQKKMTFSYFLGKIQKMALFGQIWVIFDLTCQLYIACGFQLKLFYFALLCFNFS